MKKKTSSIIHGDLCLSNILIDPNNLLFKFIDPRGSFGEKGTSSIYGDSKYDLAKLRHSFNGFYDFIIADLFILDEQKTGFEFHTSHQDKHLQIATLFDDIMRDKGYDVKAIMLIEAILFLSMIPLHADKPNRQKAMYLTAVLNINKFMTYAHSN